MWEQYDQQYDPSYNYVQLLDDIWYDPKKPELYGSNSNALSYSDMDDDTKNRSCFRLIILDGIGKETQRKQKLKIQQLINPNIERKEWFVTLGFKDDIQLLDFQRWIEKFMKKDTVIKLKGKYEIHTDKGYHPHFHMELQMNYKQSKVIQYIWESAGIKKILESRNFIDVKPKKSYHEDYLDGFKTDEKIENVEKDRTFREKHNIPEFYEK